MSDDPQEPDGLAAAVPGEASVTTARHDEDEDGLRAWIRDHDESWLFVIIYITLAVVLSIWISLFWLVVVVAGHGVLEWIRHRQIDRRPRGVLVRVLWEIKLDIALVLFALVIGVYMEFILGVAGLSSAARAGLQTGARFAGWQRAIRGVLLSLDDAAQLGRAVAGGRSDDSPTVDEVEGDRTVSPDRAIWGGWTRRWSIGDWLSLGLAALSVGLLASAPLLTDHSIASTLEVMLEELHPYPPREEIPAEVLFESR